MIIKLASLFNLSTIYTEGFPSGFLTLLDLPLYFWPHYSVQCMHTMQEYGWFQSHHMINIMDGISYQDSCKMILARSNGQGSLGDNFT